jgi:hypothetical protein
LALQLGAGAKQQEEEENQHDRFWQTP